MRKNKSGFTIVELLVVITIIAILASIVVVTYRGTQGRARDDRRKTDIHNITKALELYYSDNNAYPLSTGTASALGSMWYSSGDTSWTVFSSTLTGAGAISTVPSDPSPMTSLAPWVSNGYQYTYIANGTCGTMPQGQWYLLVWRHESSPQSKTSIGGSGCTTNSYVTTANAGGASYYLFSRT